MVATKDRTISGGLTAVTDLERRLKLFEEEVCCPEVILIDPRPPPFFGGSRE